MANAPCANFDQGDTWTIGLHVRGWGLPSNTIVYADGNDDEEEIGMLCKECVHCYVFFFERISFIVIFV